MFLAIVFIVLGLFLLLDALGIIIGANLWGLFWALIFLAVGIRLLLRRKGCPLCGKGAAIGLWEGKIHEKMHEHCNCDQPSKKKTVTK